MNNYQKTLYPKHRDKAIARAKAWSVNNKRRQDENKKRWLDKNRKQHNRSVRRWAESNPIARNAINRAWCKRNPDKVRAKVARQRARRVEAPGVFTAADVRAQYLKQNGLCYWCTTPLEKYHVDHVIPLSKGGTNYPSNIVCACPTCNLKKSNKAPAVFRAQLKGIHRADV